MEKYRQKTALASASDHFLRMLLAIGAGVLWFVWLWGLSLAALAAGIALGGLFWLCLRQLGKKQVRKREKEMRCILGGEMALDKLLMLPDRHAAFQAALWISPKAPVEMQRTVDHGVTGTLRGDPVLVWLIARHKSTEIGVQDVLEAVRAAKSHNAFRLFLCVTAPVSKSARQYAEEADLGVRIVSREELVILAGACNPATDEDLLKLKPRKRAKRSLHQWAAIVLSPARSKRYLWYGLGLAGLALVTRQPFYPIPAAVCLLLFGGTLLYRKKATEMPW